MLFPICRWPKWIAIIIRKKSEQLISARTIRTINFLDSTGVFLKEHGIHMPEFAIHGICQCLWLKSCSNFLILAIILYIFLNLHPFTSYSAKIWDCLLSVVHLCLCSWILLFFVNILCSIYSVLHNNTNKTTSQDSWY